MRLNKTSQNWKRKNPVLMKFTNISKFTCPRHENFSYNLMMLKSVLKWLKPIIWKWRMFSLPKRRSETNFFLCIFQISPSHHAALNISLPCTTNIQISGATWCFTDDSYNMMNNHIVESKQPKYYLYHQRSK